MIYKKGHAVMEKVKRKLTKMGNSVGVAIPQDVREHM